MSALTNSKRRCGVVMVDLNEISSRQYAAAVRIYRSSTRADGDIERLIAEDLPALISRLRVVSEVAAATCQEHCCTQRTACASCGKHKHTPLRRNDMGGYVCLTCVDKLLNRLGALVALWEEHAQSERIANPADAAAYAATASCARSLRETMRGGE